ncbi:hypothetical protein CPB83DRAFT_841318 [Crepidotus variabilis]|uniref:Zn(2)-C6 fungal-type domain-containing protein n=1 Tax=Crepidotus variabilis TaxID=179855 RepID=A0A9P6BBL9_9AGAR|nr:hypothetical protein CPB83DRAFT_841318 [Crepidotus variabilis]
MGCCDVAWRTATNWKFAPLTKLPCIRTQDLFLKFREKVLAGDPIDQQAWHHHITLSFEFMEASRKNMNLNYTKELRDYLIYLMWVVQGKAIDSPQACRTTLKDGPDTERSATASQGVTPEPSAQAEVRSLDYLIANEDSMSLPTLSSDQLPNVTGEQPTWHQPVELIAGPSTTPSHTFDNEPQNAQAEYRECDRCQRKGIHCYPAIPKVGRKTVKGKVLRAACRECRAQKALCNFSPIRSKNILKQNMLQLQAKVNAMEVTLETQGNAIGSHAQTLQAMDGVLQEHTDSLAMLANLPNQVAAAIKENMKILIEQGFNGNSA